MKTLSVALMLSAIGMALVIAVPAEAAKKKRHHSASRVTANAMMPGGTTATFDRGVLAGPLYNGQDYLGDDPDPNIRAYLLKDQTRYYGAH
jgi:hypothetical protein